MALIQKKQELQVRLPSRGEPRGFAVASRVICVMQDLLKTKGELEAALDERAWEDEEDGPHEAWAEDAPAASDGWLERKEAEASEMLAVLEHRRQAQQAVEEQERKIAELTALQEELRARLAEMEMGEEVTADLPSAPPPTPL